MDKNNKKPDIISMARKKRHILLLEKLQKNKPLSKAELRELEGYEGAKLAPGTVTTQEDVAKAFGVTERTVSRWIRAGMPKAKAGHYKLIKIKEWRAAKLNKHKSSKAIKPDKNNWDERFRKAKAQKAELDYQQAIGRLVSIDEIEAGRIERILIVKKALLSLPKDVAPQITGMDPREVQSFLDKRIREVIAKFSGQM